MASLQRSNSVRVSCGATKEKIRVSVRMIANEMSARGDFLGEGARFADIFAHEKKGGPRLVLLEQIEEFGGDGRVGSVIEGQGKFSRAVSLIDGTAEQLRSGIACAVGSQSRQRGTGGDSKEPRFHRRYFATTRVRDNPSGAGC